MLITESQIILEKMAYIVACLFFIGILFIVGSQIQTWLMAPALNAEDKKKHISKYLFVSFIFVLLAIYFLIVWPIDWWTLGVAMALGIASSFFNVVASLNFLTTLLLIRPWEISKADPILNVLPRVASIIVLVMLGLRFFRDRRIIVFWSKECTYLIIFTAWLFLTSTQASSPEASQTMYLDTFSRCIILFFLIVNGLRYVTDVHLFKIMLIVSSIAVSILAIVYSFVFAQSEMTGRLTFVGLLGDPNDITAFSVMALPFALVPLWKKNQRYVSWFIAVGVSILTLVCIYLAQSRGAILSFLALIVCITIYKSKRV